MPAEDAHGFILDEHPGGAEAVIASDLGTTASVKLAHNVLSSGFRSALAGTAVFAWVRRWPETDPLHVEVCEICHRQLNWARFLQAELYCPTPGGTSATA